MAGELSADLTFIAKIRDENNNQRSQFQYRNLLTLIENEQSSAAFKVAGGITDKEIPFGSVTKGHFIILNFSRKVRFRFDAGDVLQWIGPGPLILVSSDDGITQVLITTAVGEDVLIETIIAGGV